MAATAANLGDQVEKLSNDLDYWEKHFQIFQKDLDREDQQELRKLAEELRIKRQEKNYLDLVKEHPSQLNEINKLFKDKGIRLINNKPQPTQVPIKPSSPVIDQGQDLTRSRRLR